MHFVHRIRKHFPLRFVVLVTFVHSIFLRIRHHGNGVNADAGVHYILACAGYVYFVAFPDAWVASEDVTTDIIE